MEKITYRALAAEAEETWKPDPVQLLEAVKIVERQTSIYFQSCPPGEFDVRSEHSLNGWYHVDTHTHTCTCTASQPGHACAHRLAVWLYTQQITRTHAQASHRAQAVIMRELGYT